MKRNTAAMEEHGLKPQVFTGYDPREVADQLSGIVLSEIVWLGKRHVVLYFYADDLS